MKVEKEVKKETITNEKRLEDLKTQLKQVEHTYIKIQGAIELLEVLVAEK